MTDENKITFAELNLDPRIQSAIDAAGYEHPTPIQEQAIPVIKKGGDVTGIAQTGTGKTAAFTLPMMHRLTKGRARARMPRSLILCPTRELAAQVSENFETYGKDLKLNMALLIGGVSFKEQEQKLMRGVDVLIATPGRLIDQFERGKILLTGATASVKGVPRSAAFAMGKFALRGLAQSMARELHPKGVHILHVVIDGGIRNVAAQDDDAAEARLDPAALADATLNLLDQPRSVWAWEVDLRPWVETF